MAATHLVLIPSFNSGGLLAATAATARHVWPDVWVVIDGSTDGSERPVLAHAARDPGLRVLSRAGNGGKGAAVHDGLVAAAAEGFTHVLVMDADLQHPTGQVVPFMRQSMARPEAMVLGRPRFGPDAPLVRVHGRRLSNWATALETGGAVGDW